MRLRISAAIFVCVAVTLLACGVVIYVAARSVLLSDLDKSLLARAASRPELVDANGAHTEADHPLEVGDRYVIKAESDHRTLHSSHRDRDTAPPAQIRLLGRGEFARLADGRIVRTVTVAGFARPAPDAPPIPVIITFSGSTDHYFAMLHRLRLVLAGGGFCGCAAAAGVAWLLAGASLRPLRSTAQAIGAIDERSLDQRIATDGLPVELAPVAKTLNSMLDGLERALKRRKQFMADAAHELRTPVAALITELEVALRRPRPPEAYREVLHACLYESRFLRRLVETLLAQARSEITTPGASSSVGPDDSPVDVDATAEECVRLLRPIAEQRQVTLRMTGDGCQYTVAGDPDRLRSVMINLLTNAIDYNRPGGEVTLAVRAFEVTGDQPEAVEIEVADDGPGIAAEHLPRIFDPFFRADPSRRGGEHLGLGLFLVQSHVQALEGSIDVESTPGAGTRIRVRLPISGKRPGRRLAANACHVSPSSHPISVILSPVSGAVKGQD